MNRGIFVTGTDTGVGKTVVSAVLVECLRQSGLDVGVMKPFETGCPEGRGLTPPDGLFLRTIAGVDDQIDDIVPCRFALPLAPLVASELEKKPVRLASVMSAFSRLLEKHDIVVVEGAGGLLVPIARTPSIASAAGHGSEGDGAYFMSNLIREMQLPVIIVARATLGTINHTLLTVRQARSEGLEVLGIVVNHAVPPTGSPAEMTNPAIIGELSGCPVLATVPFMQKVSAGAIRDAALTVCPGLAPPLTTHSLGHLHRQARPDNPQVS